MFTHRLPSRQIELVPSMANRMAYGGSEGGGRNMYSPGTSGAPPSVNGRRYTSCDVWDVEGAIFQWSGRGRCVEALSMDIP